MSAVSNRVMPASSAACTTRRVAARSRRVPKLLQPTPTSETRSPVCANCRCSISGAGKAKHARRVAAEDQVAIVRGNRKLADARDAIEIPHVEGIIAAEQDVRRADRRDQEFERRPGMKNGVVEQAGDRVLRAVLKLDLGLGPDLETVPEAAGLIGQESAAVREADLEPGIVLDHAAEHEARARDGGLERQADEVLQVI